MTECEKQGNRVLQEPSNQQLRPNVFRKRHLQATTDNEVLLREADLSGQLRTCVWMSGVPAPRRASATCLEKVKLPPKRVLHIDHMFARMQRLNAYEAKTNAMTRIGSNLSQVLPPPFSCE